MGGRSDQGLRLGIDVGGTFTDVVAVGTGGTVRGKVPSTPGDPAVGVLAACELIAGELGTDLPALLGRVVRFGLGTTVVTNVLATRSGLRLGLLTTAGFEDLIPLARGNRLSEGGWLVPPPSLVDRGCVIGIRERTDRDGRITAALDTAQVAEAARRLVTDEHVEAIVVSLLWSFRNPANEQAVRDIIAAAHPDLPVMLGSALAPVIREYERTQFVLLNAYVGGALDWLGPLAGDLRDHGLTAPLVLTHSSGGATTVDGARAVPIGLAQSGPAAGAAAATQLARTLDEPDLVTCDLGGTSLDVALITGGEALRRTRGRIVGHWTAMSMVDVDSVGSGGGSIAWVDPMGAIRVGPHSAGAAPGPACYGRGGTDATLTDALVVLGYLDPAAFLGGRMPLDRDAALAACGRVGEQAGLDVLSAAWGIREVALATMARAVRARIAGRGLVPAELTLLAYGGCGGLFAADIAAEVGARRSIVPELASVLSAYGAATAALHRERARSLALRLPADPALLGDTFGSLADDVTRDLDADGVEAGARALRLEADVRFERQGAELTVTVERDQTGEIDVAGIEDAFRREYMRRFGKGAVAMGVAAEVMTLRVVGSATSSTAEAVPPHAPRGVSAVARRRGVHLHRGGDAVRIDVWRAEDLLSDVAVRGPAIIDVGDTTVWVPDGHVARTDHRGAITIEIEEP